MQKPYEVNIDLYDSFVLKTAISYISGDIGTMPLLIRLLSRGEPVKLLDGDIIALNFENPAGDRFERIAQIVGKESGEAAYEIQDGDIAVAGDVTVGVTLTRNEKKVSWLGFAFAVIEGYSDGQAEPPAGMVSSQSFFALNVNENGELEMLVGGNKSPSISVDDNGCLIYELQGGND